MKATITINEKHNGIEIKFTEKPEKEVREQLKDNGFKWHNKNQLWYARNTDSNLSLARSLAEEPAADRPAVALATFAAPTFGIPSTAAEQPDESRKEQLAFERKTDEPQPEEGATNNHYYTIDENAARRAKNANSYSEYNQGSATVAYRAMVDDAVQLAERQKRRTDPMHHDKIDKLLDAYCRKLADNLNSANRIDARVPSILIAGGSNFPVRAKEKQNAARDRNMQEYFEVQNLLEKIKSVGTGGISADDPNAIEKLEQKLKKREAFQAKMKAVNAYFRKHNTLVGCPELTPEEVSNLAQGMSESWHVDKSRPFQSYELSNNNAEIRRLKARVDELKKHSETSYVGWMFDGGEAVANKSENRLQLVFTEKPDEATRNTLKANGFKWSPNNNAWQRQLTDNAIWITKRLLVPVEA